MLDEWFYFGHLRDRGPCPVSEHIVLTFSASIVFEGVFVLFCFCFKLNLVKDLVVVPLGLGNKLNGWV